MKEKSSASITHQLKDDSVATLEEFREFQEDLKLAEKEALLSHQKRSTLLDTLRQSVQKSHLPSQEREATRAENVRLIRSGTASDIKNVTTRLKKELQSLKKKGQLSNPVERDAKLFFDKANVFTEKKSILERLEYTLDTYRFSFSAEMDSPSPKKDSQSIKHAKLMTLAQSVRSDIQRLMEEMLQGYEKIEKQIQEDIEQEEEIRTFFFSCLSALDEKKRRQFMTEFHAKFREATIERRISLYKAVTEKLAKTNPAVGAKIHILARKKARDYLKQGLYKKAEAELYYVLQLQKNNPDSYRLLATVFTRQQDTKRAFAALREVLRLQPDDLLLRKRIANMWYRMGKKDQAIAEYDEILLHTPNDDAVRRDLGKTLFKTGKYLRCQEIVTEYLSRFPDDFECVKWVGLSWAYSQHWKNAIPFLRRVVEQTPQDIETVRTLSIGYRKLEMYDETISLLQNLLKEQPESVSFWVLLGATYQDCGEWELAEKSYTKAIELHQPTASLLFSIGQVKAALGKSAEAIRMYEDALKMDKKKADTVVELAKELRKEKHYDQAESLLRNHLDIHPENTAIRQELALIYTEQGNWEKATNILKTD